MDGQSFHTSLLGGFRKKDVIRYLAAEKQRQEAELNQLREKQLELERSTAAEKQEEQTSRWKTEALQARIAALQEENAAQAQELEALRAEQQTQDGRTMEVETLRARIRTLEAGQASGDALRQCREELEKQRQRADALEEELRLRQNAPEESLSETHLRELCRRLEQSLELLDKAMDGPRTMICYPVSEEDRALLIRYGVVPEHLPEHLPERSVPEEEPAPEVCEAPEQPSEASAETAVEASEESPAMPEEPVEETPEAPAETPTEMPADAPTEEPAEASKKPETSDEPVSRLLERVRGWRK